MRLLTSILLAILLHFTFETFAQTIHLKDYNIAEVKDATPVVVKAIEDAKAKGIRKIKFPKGTYHFYKTFAPDFYCAITNNDNGLKRTPFPIMGFHELEIDGNGAEFIFHGKMIPFIIENSENITIRNLSIDWEKPFYIEGEVIANNPDTKTFDVKINTDYKVANGHLYVVLERDDTPYEKDFGFRFAIPEGDQMEVGQNIFWDKKLKKPLYNTKLYQLNTRNIEAKELQEGIVRLKAKSKELPPVGAVLNSKGAYLFNRTSPAFRVFKTKNIIFNNVNVYHAGAMGLIAERSENIKLDAFNVKLREGSQRMVTTTADATHFCNNKGVITIKNCLFENMLDDATNIHGTYVRVNKVIDEYSVAVETYHPHQKGYLFGEAGDSVRIVDHNKLQPKTTSLALKEVKYVNEKISILTFHQSIKGKVELYNGIENISWNASAIIENNIIRNNRARSILLSTNQPVVIRNNYLSSQMSSIRITGDLRLWNESGPTNSVLIENNTFEDCLYGGNPNQSIILIDPQYKSKEMMDEKYKYCKDICIKNNVIKSFENSILTAQSVEGIEFTNNKIVQTNTYQAIFPKSPNVDLRNCSNVKISSNSFMKSNGEKGTLKVDGKTETFDLPPKSAFEFFSIMK
ncbi:alpha-1,3-galactosidase-related protein [Flammeovirga aprica]|uniref:Right-handed parallel beta-helix repeat-containing protein n=1 Tax=Flammeovirga aprica JL-4 TaxID=694437 RepID=A0A7X9S066_9BACT|nr:hypothetical protein [Flammeovirga aprica]NME71814.1 hypothetical protein [Flammeovirga aprica JL-4]